MGAAGLTDDDVPTTWEELESVAATLTTDGQVGLSFGPEWQRIGTFMAQAGGGLVSEDGTEAIADSPENLEALLVQFLTSGEQQMAFATAFGVMPSIDSVSEEWTAQFPEQEAFLAGADYAQGVPNADGASDVVADFNSQIQGLGKGADPQAVLTSAQTNLEAVVGG